MIAYFLLVLVVLTGTFYLGYLYGQRQSYNQQDSQIRVVAGNQARRNSLSDIQVIDIWGAVTKTKSTGFGQLYLKVSQNQTELLLRLQNVPLKIVGSSGSLELPSALSIETAALTSDGLDYNYTQIGRISLDEPINGLRTGEFSTILDYSIFDPKLAIQRIVLRAEDQTIQNLFLDEDPNLPAQVRREPAPLFWAVL